ncbi:MAG: galactose-1-phosphate uridylyltransferase, partial [bacterium]
METIRKNQFRRNPITGEWSIIVHDKYDFNKLITSNKPRNNANTKENTQCQFCRGLEAETPPEIFSIRHNHSLKNEPGWSVRVIPNKQPFLQIYGELNNRGVGMYDVLDGIGAHELVIEAPGHNIQLYDMKLQEIEDVLLAYRERILDLKKDTRFRYVLLHKNYGEGNEDVMYHSHSHIIATPITPTRVKSELINAMEH